MDRGKLVELAKRLEQPLVIEYAVPLPVHEVLQRAADERAEAAAALRSEYLRGLEDAARVARECRYVAIGDGYFDPYVDRQDAIVGGIEALKKEQ